MNTPTLSWWSLTCLLAGVTLVGAEQMHTFFQGEALNGAHTQGAGWQITRGELQGSGTGGLLQLDVLPDEEPFLLSVRITLERVEGTAASLVINGNSHFGFDSRGRTLFLEGPVFGGGVRELVPTGDFIRPGEPFVLELVRRDGLLNFRLDGETVYEMPSIPVEALAFRPHRNGMKLSALTLTGVLVTPPEPLPMTAVYTSGTGGYHTYRIPAIEQTGAGTLLAFCEGRKGGGGDSGNIDLLVKRSEDGGASWGPAVVVWDDAGNTCGNPAPVLDRMTGTLWLLMTWNRGDDHEGEIIKQTSRDTRRIYVTHSTDDGRTWADPEEITSAVKQDDWTWYATGPGHGIQLERGAHRGRMVIPCDHIEADTRGYYSHAIYSDDHGATWQRGASTPTDQVNECTVAERSDGGLILNMRNYDRAQKTRQVAFSRDGGATWQDQRHDEALVEPICQASLLRWTWPADGVKNRLLFANPASTNGRRNMTVRISYDEGQTWPVAHPVYAGGSAYCDLVRLDDTRAGLLFEKDGYRSIEYVPLSLEALEPPDAR